MNHQQHLASLDKGMSSAERASLVRSNSSSMSSQMAAITAVRLQVCFCLFTCYSKGERSCMRMCKIWACVVKVYRWSRHMAPLILVLDRGWRWLFGIMLQPIYWKGKNSWHLPKYEYS
jgi:hypothetical protein